MFFPQRSGPVVLLKRTAGQEYWLALSPGAGDRSLERNEAVSVALRAIHRDRMVAREVNQTLIQSRLAPGYGLSGLQWDQRLIHALRTGQLAVVVRTHSFKAYTHSLPDDAPAPPPPAPLEPEEVEVRYLRRLEIGYLTFPPSHPAMLPGLSLSRSPWAGLVAAARHMEAQPGDTPLFCFHQAHDEPAQMSEVRSGAFHAFIRDDRERWVELQAEHGSILDTQAFLSYLAQVKSWPLTVKVTGHADTQTQEAVLAFQRFYNPAYDDDIYEDGIVGRQTLGAIFSVAKDDATQWFELNEADYAQLYHVPEDAYLACEARYSTHPKFAIGSYGGNPRALDILFIPADQEFSLLATPAGAGIYLDDVTFHTVPVQGIRAPQSHLLIVQLIDQWGRPVANADYELTVGDDHRIGTTDAKGEIVEANLPNDIPLVKLVDGRIIIFHDRYRAALKKLSAPKPAPAYMPTDESLGSEPGHQDDADAEELLDDHDQDAH